MARLAPEKTCPRPAKAPHIWAQIDKGKSMSVEIYFGNEKVTLDESFADFVKSQLCRWRVEVLNGKKYLCRAYQKRGEVKDRLAHRHIMNAKRGQIVDHINGDSLDNRRENLRICTHRQNLWNSLKVKPTSSRFKGVSLNRKKWVSRIATESGPVRLGTYYDEVEAAFMYDIASLKYHGEYGRRNFLPLVLG